MKRFLRSDRFVLIVICCIAFLLVDCMSKVVVDAKTTHDFYHQNKPDTDYFYKQMNAREKAFFDQLKKQSEAFYWGYQEPYKFKFSDGSDGYCYGDLDLGLLSYERAQQIAELFYYSCPQYFFTRGILLRVEGKYCVMIREDYCTREIIDSNRNQIEAKTKIWLEELAKYDDDLKLEKAIFKKIHDNTEYGKIPRYDKDGNQVYDKYGDPVYNSNNQEIVGTFADGKTVCNGYAKIMQYLCNYAGLECLYMESTETGNHAFNMIKLYDDWYCIDVTEPTEKRRFSSDPVLNESYETFRKTMGDSHVINEQIAEYGMSLPKCDRNLLIGGVMKQEVYIWILLVLLMTSRFFENRMRKICRMKEASDTESMSTIELSEKDILRQIHLHVPEYFYTKPYTNNLYIFHWPALVCLGIIFIWAFKSVHKSYLMLFITDNIWGVAVKNLGVFSFIGGITFYLILCVLYNLARIYIMEPRRLKKLYSKINQQEDCLFYTFYSDCLCYKTLDKCKIIRYRDLSNYSEDPDKLFVYYKPEGGFTLDKKQCSAEDINFVKALISEKQPQKGLKSQSRARIFFWSCFLAHPLIIRDNQKRLKYRIHLRLNDLVKKC